MLAVPLLMVEVAGDANASPGDVPVSFAAALSDELPADATHRTSVDLPARSVGSVTGDDLAAPRLFSVFTQGEALRAQAAADAEAADELARQAEIEDERQRQIDREDAERERLRREAAEREAAQREAAAVRRAEAEAEAATPPPPAQGMPGGTTAAQWQALRQCESSGNYGAVNSVGPYLGAYQFLQSTWDGTARSAGRGDLVGVAPNQAAPGDQDAMAYALYARSGSGPWPHCGAHLH